MTNPSTTDRALVAEGLRRWAKGVYTTEAAAELLIRAMGGRLLSGPWVRQEGDLWVFDTDATDGAGYLSGGERRVLRIAASLADDDHQVSLSEVVPGLDAPSLDLVVAAVAHAGGRRDLTDQ